MHVISLEVLASFAALLAAATYLRSINGQDDASSDSSSTLEAVLVRLGGPSDGQ